MLGLNKLKTNQTAFSLLEIIIALSILAVSFLGLVNVFPLGMNMNQSSKNKTVASYLAQEKVETLFSRGYDNIATGTVEIKQRMATSTNDFFYRYQRETEVSYIDGNLNPIDQDEGMKQISTTVYYLGGLNKQEQVFRLNTIISKN